jgi:menaquinone-specific isochorismate synthase
VSTPLTATQAVGALRARTLRIHRDHDLLVQAGERGFFWRSARHELVTRGVAVRIPLEAGPGRIAAAAGVVSALLAQIRWEGPEGAPGPVAVGALPFADLAPGALVVPELVVRRDASGALWETRISANGTALAGLPQALREPGAWPATVSVRSGQDRAGWDAMVARALAAIAAGELAKVVLAREVLVEADRPFSRAAALRRLAARAAGCLLYAHDGFVGASPELLVRRHGPLVVSCPLAGTAARGGVPPAEEAGRLARLVASAKDAAEHRFVVEAVVAALGRAGARLTVHPRSLIRLATVAHLATRVEAELPEPAPSALALAGLLHPTPAVAGTPTARALALLGRLEPFERGLYGGPVGWVDARGDGEWAVALRGADLAGRRARLLAGAGIVAGSDPADEWAETEAKLDAMLGVLTV